MECRNGSSNVKENNQNEKQIEPVNSIILKYESSFIQLENEANSRLNELIKLAKNEYSTKKVNGEKISYGYFYRKYSTAATELEDSIDVSVDFVKN